MDKSRKYRFVEYETDIWMIVGIGYDSQLECEVFEIVPLKRHLNIIRANISIYALRIPMGLVMEISDPTQIRTILSLYS